MTSAELKAALVKQQEISNGLPATTIQALSAQVAALSAQVAALSDALDAALVTIADHEARLTVLEPAG
jgi:phage I-like protein